MDDISKQAQTFFDNLDLDGKYARIGEIEKESGDPKFWQDKITSVAKMQELSVLQKEVQEAEELKGLINQGKTNEAERLLGKLEVVRYLSGPYDKEAAILSIHSGQGGTEAMDWAQMLERMYIHFAQKKDWKVTEVDSAAGEEAGIKSAALIIEGRYAYGYLKNEAGAHRLVRQSPFNADHLRQTSFALVEVLPQLPETEEIEPRDEDLEWQFFHSSSQGGQNVQKVSTAVRLTHKPTGIVVTAQAERYQEQNRKIALRLLAAKLWARREEEREREERELKGAYKPASWGNQIRSYVLHPYKLVKDLRTGVETSAAESVLDGELDEFIEEGVKIVV